MTESPARRSVALPLSQKRTARPKLDVERVELSNGLVLLLSENHSIPSVSINAIVKTGSRFEPDKKAGLASIAGRSWIRVQLPARPGRLPKPSKPPEGNSE